MSKDELSSQKHHVCETCGTVLVCPKCNPPKKRALNAQAQAVKSCLDAYVAARNDIKEPYPGIPPAGKVVQWLGQQPDRDAAVDLFQIRCQCAAMAHTFDHVYHPFPMTVPKFVEAIPKLNESWVDGARRAAAERRGETPGPIVKPVTPAQRVANDAERARIARQTDCAAELRFGQRGADECGIKDECRGCPQRESPGRDRYRPASRYERKDGGLKPAVFEPRKDA